LAVKFGFVLRNAFVNLGLGCELFMAKVHH
jgi:hypothetical protein